MANGPLGLDCSEMVSYYANFFTRLLYQDTKEIMHRWDRCKATGYRTSTCQSPGVTGQDTTAVTRYRTNSSTQCEACPGKRRSRRISRKRRVSVCDCLCQAVDCDRPEGFEDVSPSRGDYAHIAELRRHSDLVVLDKLGLLEMPHEQQLAVFSSRPQLYRLVELISDAAYPSDSEDLQQSITGCLQIP